MRPHPLAALLLAISFVPKLAGADAPAPQADCPIGHISRAVEGPTPKPVLAPKKQAWERRHGGKDAAKPHVVARLSARPTRRLADPQSLAQSDAEFARRLARDTWSGLLALTDKENGLPVDHIRFVDADDRDTTPGLPAPPTKTAAAAPAIEVGDYTNVTSIGLHLIAIVAAHDIELIGRQQALDNIRRVLTSLTKLERHRGLFFNYYDTTTLERTSRFISFVDLAWLTAGLMVTRSAFPEVRADCTELIQATDFGFFYDRKTRQITHGHFVDPPRRSPYDYGMLYTEARIGSLIAIGKGDVEREQWWAMARILPAGCGWQSLAPRATATRVVGDASVLVGHYAWNDVPFVPSWGGSMFEALMPTLVLDETLHAAASLGWNDHAHAFVQRRYAFETLAYPVWGMSPSARPGVDAYSEYGVPVLGVRGYAPGAVAPYASALALAVTPQAALANLRQLAEGYEVYGEYGFYDAVDPRSGVVAYRYLALDQSMLFIALANYLRPHCIQQHFAADPITQTFLPLLAAEGALWPAAAAVEPHGKR